MVPLSLGCGCGWRESNLFQKLIQQETLQGPINVPLIIRDAVMIIGGAVIICATLFILTLFSNSVFPERQKGFHIMKYALQQDATSHITGFQNTVSSYAVYFFVKLTIQEKEVLINLV